MKAQKNSEEIFEFQNKHPRDKKKIFFDLSQDMVSN